MTRTKTRTEFVDKCKKQMHRHLKKTEMIITYLRESNPRSYGARPTQKEAYKICTMLNAAPDMTPDGYIGMLKATGSKKASKEEKIEELKQKFLTARSYWRSRRTARVGVVIAFKEEGEIHIGWSLCKTSAGDRFDRYIGVYEALRKDDKGNFISAYPLGNPKGLPNMVSVENLVARTRNEMDARKKAKKEEKPLPPCAAISIPHTLLPHVEAMMDRAKKQLT